jgi:O-antigen/teichoic acid export membrane protein
MSRLSRNVLYNLLGQGLLLVLGLLAARYVFRQLGSDALGIIYAAATLAIVLSGVLELGVSSTTVREVATHARDDPGYVRELIQTASLLYWGAYLVLAVTVYVGSPLLVEKWIRLETMPPATATHALRVLGITALLVLPRSLYTSLFRGVQRMEFNNVIDVAVAGLQQLGTVLILAAGGGLFAVVYWVGGCFVVGMVPYLALGARFFSGLALLPAYRPAVIRRNLAFSVQMMWISVLAMVHTNVDKLLVSKVLPLGTFGYYAFASGVVSRGTLVSGAIAQAAFPSFATLAHRRDHAGLVGQYRALHDLLCFATVPLFAAITFAALPLYRYLFNSGVADQLLLPTALLCVGFYMNGTLTTPYVLSLAMGRPDISARANSLALFIVLPAAVVLVLALGLTGAALTWVVYHLFAYGYTVPRICAECLRLPVRGWYGHVARIAALAGVTYGLAWLGAAATGNLSTRALALAYLAASLGFLLGAKLLIGVELRQALMRFPHPRRAGGPHIP